MIEREKLRELLQRFDTAVLITHGKKSFRARPMVIAGVENSCDLWFISSLESAKVHEIQKDTRVQVVCQNGRSSCICITGRASLNFDRAKILELWNPEFEAWFPKGVNDPDVVLIHVLGEQAEYWDNSGLNQLNYLYQTVRALVTGSPPEIREGEEHGRVEVPGRPLSAKRKLRRIPVDAA